MKIHNTASNVQPYKQAVALFNIYICVEEGIYTYLNVYWLTNTQGKGIANAL